MNEGFNIVYAKNGGIPKNIFLEERFEVTKFLLYNLNDIDFISINDVIVDKKKIAESNIKLLRYLKLSKIYEI